MDFNKYIVDEDNAVSLFPCNDIDIKELVSFLRSNTRITKLYLTLHKIGDGAKELAKLTHLHLIYPATTLVIKVQKL